MSLCGFCGLPLSEAPSRGCARCGDRLHDACWAQVAARGIVGCGHAAGVVGVAYPREGLVVSLDSGGVLRAWDAATGADREVHRLASGTAMLLLASDDGARLFAIEYNRVTVLRTDDFALEASHAVNDGLNAAAVSRDGARLALATYQTLRTLDVATGALAPVGGPLAEAVSRVALSPDGARVAALWGQGQLCVRDADTGESLCERDVQPVVGYADKLEFTPSGDELLIDGNGTLYAFDGLTGQQHWRQELGAQPLRIRRNEDATFTLVMYSGDGDVRVHRLDRNANPALAAPQVFPGLTLGPSRVAFLDARRAVAAADDGTLLALDAAAERARVLDGHRNHAWLSPDAAARLLWTRRGEIHGGDSGAVFEGVFTHPGPTSTGWGLRRFSLGTGALAAEGAAESESPTAVRSLVHEGRRYTVLVVGNALALRDETGAQRWRTEIGKYSDHTQLALLPDGAGGTLLLTAASWSALVLALDLETGALRWALERSDTSPVPNGNLVRRRDGTVLWLLRRPNCPSTVVDCHQLAPDGSTTLAGALECTLPFGTELGGFTPDGTRLVMGSLYVPPLSRPVVAVWDLERFRYVGPVTQQHRNGLRSLAVSPAGATAATASGDRVVRVWSLATGRPVAAFGGFARPVSRVQFGDDGTVLLVFTDDGNVTAWDLDGVVEEPAALS